MFIDSHAHLTCDALYFDLDQIIERAREAGVEKIINICTDEKTLERGKLAKKRFPLIENVGATTPHDVEELGEKEFTLFEHAAQAGDLIAIGETGLDYYYQDLPKTMQQDLFIRYIMLAKQYHLPLVIHCREAFSDLFAIADREYGSEKLLLHCFTGTLKEAFQAIDRGWKISLSGIVTFKKSEALREVAKAIPMEHLFIETDSPYLAPQSKRGQRCEPAFAYETLTIIAALKQCSVEELGKVTMENTRLFFSLCN